MTALEAPIGWVLTQPDALGPDRGPSVPSLAKLTERGIVFVDLKLYELMGEAALDKAVADFLSTQACK